MTETGRSTGADRLPLSFNQEFLCVFDSGDDSGPFGPRYLIVFVWRLTGSVDETALRAALGDVVDRHEALRTRIFRAAEPRHQRVYPPSPPRLEVRECPGVPPDERAARAEAFLNELEAGSVDADELPNLRAVLMRFDRQDAVLALMAHHTAADGWSMRVLARDLTACYAARRTGGTADLPPARQYRAFVVWERAQALGAPAAAARKYWRQALHGTGLTALPADHPRSANLPPVTAAKRFVIPAGTAAAVRRAAKNARCSPFMVLLAAYYRLVHRITGATDIVVPTNTPGRGNGRFDDTVGSFFNFLPLRVDMAGAGAVDLLLRTRDTCLAAYANDIPALQVFDAAPDLMAPAMRDDLAPVTFQVLPSAHVLDAAPAGDLTFTEVRQRTGTVPVVAQIPDGALWTLGFDESGEILGNLSFRTDRFDHETADRMVAGYRHVLEDLVAELDRPALAG